MELFVLCHMASPFMIVLNQGSKIVLHRRSNLWSGIYGWQVKLNLLITPYFILDEQDRQDLGAATAF